MLLLPVRSLTIANVIPNLQYFSANESQHVTLKALKVYLCGIRLWHIEEGFEDPTLDPLLQLVFRGIHRMQFDRCRIHLPITINLLRTMKRELQQSHYSLAEQRMLWSAFTLVFYGFLHASDISACNG